MAVPHMDKNYKQNETVDVNRSSKPKRFNQKNKKQNQKQKQQRRNKKDKPHYDSNRSVTSDSSTCGWSSSSESSHASSSSNSHDGNRQRNNRKHNNNRRPAAKRQPKVVVTQEEMNQYVAMDCEMVGVGMDGHTSALARVTIIDWHGKVLLDKYIKPDREVTDYRTFVSGITEQHLQQEGSLDLESCRNLVLATLQDKILVGHALKNDLHSLGISHPWQQTRDTAKYEPFMKVRFDDGILWPRKLKDLAQEKLHREVQVQGKCHSPYEDAMTALDLYKSARAKWEKVMEYKINKTREIEQQKQQQRLLHKDQFPALQQPQQ